MKILLCLAGIFFTFSAVAQSDKTGDFHLDKEYDMKLTGTLRMRVSDAKVFITGSPRSTAHVKIDREVKSRGFVFGEENFSVNITEQDGDLLLKERQHSGTVSIIGSYNEQYTIKIELPEGASLEVEGDDGDYFVQNINGAIEVELDDADLELNGCKGNFFKVRLDDGDLRMDEGKGTLEIDADDADIRIAKGAFDKILADLDDGDFVVETALSNKGDYFINGQDGLIALTVLAGGGSFDIRHDDGRVITEGNFEKVESSESRTRLELANGNAKVTIHADDARVRLIR